jgi:hypothetical protein
MLLSNINMNKDININGDETYLKDYWKPIQY